MVMPSVNTTRVLITVGVGAGTVGDGTAVAVGVGVGNGVGDATVGVGAKVLPVVGTVRSALEAVGRGAVIAVVGGTGVL
jgi:hypothetical protein